MKRAQLLADFKQTFSAWISYYKIQVYSNNTGQVVFISDAAMQTAWTAWVSAYETYCKEPLTGRYDDELS